MHGEGFAGEQLAFEVELEASGADGPLVRQWPVPARKRVPDMAAAIRASAPSASGSVTLRVRASAAVPHAPMVTGSPGGQAEVKGVRRATFDSDQPAAVIYDRAQLQPGQTVRGPALVEGDDTTIVVPPGFEIRLDDLLTVMIGPGALET
jgi:N-methylhydantoinase A/oxoprolinase/acetone carboxylase beta subunit